MNKVIDLRSSLELLRSTPGQLIETDVPVDPQAELCGVYRYAGAGGTVKRPTNVNGPAMLFHNVYGHPDASVAIGVMGSRERVAKLFGCKKEELGHLVQKCAANPIMPVITNEPAPAQEVVHLATDPDFDLFKLIPAPTNTPYDAGPYITLGMCYATHPDTGLSDVTIHRMCILSKDELSIFLLPGARHIGAMAERATELGQPLPISVSIGVDPAISVTSCFSPPTTPLGFNELSIAGALRGEPVQLTPGGPQFPHRICFTRVPRLQWPRLTRVLASQGQSSDSPQESHHADLHRSQRGVRQHVRHPHGSFDPGYDRQGSPRQSAELLCAPRRRRQICRDSAVPQNRPHGRGQAAAGRSFGLFRFPGAQACDPCG